MSYAAVTVQRWDSSEYKYWNAATDHTQYGTMRGAGGFRRHAVPYSCPPWPACPEPALRAATGDSSSPRRAHVPHSSSSHTTARMLDTATIIRIVVRGRNYDQPRVLSASRSCRCSTAREVLVSIRAGRLHPPRTTFRASRCDDGMASAPLADPLPARARREDYGNGAAMPDDFNAAQRRDVIN